MLNLTRSRAGVAFAGSPLAGILLALLLVANAVHGETRLEKKDWIEVASPNFTIKSLLSKKDTLELAEELERFRAVVEKFGVARRTEAAMPIVIFAVRTRRELEALGVDPDRMAGAFVSNIRWNLILMKRERGGTLHIARHEYVHFLVRNQDMRMYPRWYDEGFAEYLAATRVRRGKLYFGDVPARFPSIIARERLLATRKVVDPSYYADFDDEEQAMFYAQSWLLVHWLSLGRGSDRTVQTDMLAYFQKLDQGAEPIPAFEAAFGVSVSELDRLLPSYPSKMKAYHMSLDQFPVEFESRFRKIPEAEMAATLGMESILMREYERARRCFAYALERDPALARAHTGMGDLLKFEGEFDAAGPYFAKALELAPDDPYVQLDVGEYWLDRARHEVKDASARETALLTAREHFVKAWKLDPEIPEVYAMNGWSFLGGESGNPEKAVEMYAEAVHRLPSNLEMRLGLAYAYELAGRADDARRTASTVAAWAHPDTRWGTEARAILDRLDGEPAPPDAARSPEAAGASSEFEPSDSARSSNETTPEGEAEEPTSARESAH